MPKSLADFLIDLAYNREGLDAYYSNDKANYILAADLTSEDKSILLSEDDQRINEAIAEGGAGGVIESGGGGNIKVIKP